MSLFVITHTPQLAYLTAEMLLHYYPNKQANSSNKMMLSLQTKYYSCQIPIIFKNQKLQTLSSDKGLEENKSKNTEQDLDNVDCVIFVVDQDYDEINNLQKIVDKALTQYQPDSYIIVVNCASQYKIAIKQKFQQAVKNCQNFIMVIVCDLKQILKNKPLWNQASLLQNQDIQQQFFQIFELMSTTPWCNSIKKEPTQQKVINKQQNHQSNQPFQKIKQNIADTINFKLSQNQQQQQMNDQQLEKQMMEFQTLMQQMVSLKTSPGTNDKQRKAKAQQLIMKLTKSYDI